MLCGANILLRIDCIGKFKIKASDNEIKQKLDEFFFYFFENVLTAREGNPNIA